MHQIMFFLKSLPKNLIDIQSKIKIENNTKPTLYTTSKPFGILKGHIKNPMQWQRDIREESDREVYGDLSK